MYPMVSSSVDQALHNQVLILIANKSPLSNTIQKMFTLLVTLN